MEFPGTEACRTAADKGSVSSRDVHLRDILVHLRGAEGADSVGRKADRVENERLVGGAEGLPGDALDEAPKPVGTCSKSKV